MTERWERSFLFIFFSWKEGASLRQLLAGLDARLLELFPFGILQPSSHDETFWQAGGKMRIETRAEWNIWLFSKRTHARCRKTYKKAHTSTIDCEYSHSHLLHSMFRGFCQGGNPTSVKEFLAHSLHLLFLTTASSQSPNSPPSSQPLALYIPLFSFLACPRPNQFSLSLFLSCQLLPLFFRTRCQISADVEWAVNHF